MNKKLQEILACPRCKGELHLSEEDQVACLSCGRIYPIRNDIPIMVIEESIP